MIHVSNLIPRKNVVIGIIRGEGLKIHAFTSQFEQLLVGLLTDRCKPLDENEEQLRKAIRDMMRNGRYRPTGRGKPASEYLVRSAIRHLDSESPVPYPRINVPVDVCNYISLKYLIPISVWDLDLAASNRFFFRLGHEDERYIFNAGGQTIELEDLIVGCRVNGGSGADGQPIVNPVKDSLTTKTTEDTTRIAASIYAPLTIVTKQRMTSICSEFASLLEKNGEARQVTQGVVLPGETVLI